MKAMILAAGRGERMRPLSDTVPKPLLKVGDKTLIEHHLYALAKAGFEDVVINVSYHPNSFVYLLKDGSQYGLRIHFSFEPEEGGLETGGGIYKALQFLGDDPFLVINADILTDYNFINLKNKFSKDEGVLAHIVLIKNPAHNLEGDFCLIESKVFLQGEPRYTLAGIHVYHPALFKNCTPGKFSVVPLLHDAIRAGKVSGEYFNGTWFDVGTVERLNEINHLLQTHALNKFFP